LSYITSFKTFKMKTIIVEAAEVSLAGAPIGTVNSISINGSLELFASSASAWVGLMGNGVTLGSKQINIGAGLSTAGADWAAIEADILSQLGLTKSANQNPSATAGPAMP
jgi:hypothetical protein